MVWVEMRKNFDYGKGWEFRECVWAPRVKKNGDKWKYWYLVGDVQQGDVIFHVENKPGEKKIIGYSIAACDGFLTTDKPERKQHEWDWSDSFYKVNLTQYKPLHKALPLHEFFEENSEELKSYFFENKDKPKRDKRTVFYAIENDKFKCQQGGYFTELEDTVAQLIFKSAISSFKSSSDVKTGESLAELKKRIGHQAWAEKVKENFGYKCAFPNCDVHGKGFLISGHIARWADNNEMQGRIGNGICLCKHHDNAFERGYFTLDNEGLRVIVVENRLPKNKWLGKFLKPETGKMIKSPLNHKLIPEAILEHWKRIGYSA